MPCGTRIINLKHENVYFNNRRFLLLYANAAWHGGDFMAVDPATAKVIIQVATKVVTDEETRNKVIAMSLIPIIAVVIIIGIPYYILTHPLEFLGELFSGDILSIEAATNFQGDYGYFGDDAIIDITGDYVESEIPLFLQGDKRWGMFLYGQTGTIAATGCGPTSLAMIVVGLTGDTSVNPKVVADWSVKNGHRVEGKGSAWSLFTSGGSHWGLNVETISVNATAISEALRQGKPIIMSMSKGYFTNDGHIMVLRGITESGKILVNDPASSTRSAKEWDVSIIVSEGVGGWAYSK